MVENKHPEDSRVTWSYTGRVYVRPTGRGIVLDDLVPENDENHLEGIVPEGGYVARLVFEPVTSEEYMSRAPANLTRLRGAAERIEGGEVVEHGLTGLDLGEAQ